MQRIIFFTHKDVDYFSIESIRFGSLIRNYTFGKRGGGTVGVTNHTPLPRREPRRSTRHQASKKETKQTVKQLWNLSN